MDPRTLTVKKTNERNTWNKCVPESQPIFRCNSNCLPLQPPLQPFVRRLAGESALHLPAVLYAWLRPTGGGFSSESLHEGGLLLQARDDSETWLLMVIWLYFPTIPNQFADDLALFFSRCLNSKFPRKFGDWSHFGIFLYLLAYVTNETTCFRISDQLVAEVGVSCSTLVVNLVNLFNFPTAGGISMVYPCLPLGNFWDAFAGDCVGYGNLHSRRLGSLERRTVVNATWPLILCLAPVGSPIRG